MTRKRDLRTRLAKQERERAAADFARAFASAATEDQSGNTAAREQPRTRTFLDALIDLLAATFSNEGWGLPKNPSPDFIRDLPLFRAVGHTFAMSSSAPQNDPTLENRLRLAMLEELAVADSPENQARIAYSALLSARGLRDSDPLTAIDHVAFAAWMIASAVVLLERQPRKKGAARLAATTQRSNLANAKEEARKLWLEGRKQLAKWRGNAVFAAECVRRWPVLKQSTIERKWIPQWEKESRAHRAREVPPCKQG